MSRHAVHDIIARYRNTGDPAPAKGAGRPRARALTPEIVERLIEYVTDHPFATLAKMREAVGTQASDSTISRRLRQHGIQVHRPARKPRLTQHLRNERLAFAVQYSTLDWNRVLFSDETTVTSAQDEGIKFVRRRTGQRYDQINVREDRRSGRVSVGIWACITSEGLGSIYRVDRRLNSEIYKRRILAYHVVPWFKDHLDGIFQQDNAPIHKAIHVMNYLEGKNITLLVWPPSSPDMSPIENFWSLLKREIGRVDLLAGDDDAKKDQLWQHILAAWNRMKTGDRAESTAATITRYYGGMPQRLLDLHAAGGGPTRH